MQPLLWFLFYFYWQFRYSTSEYDDVILDWPAEILADCITLAELYFDCFNFELIIMLQVDELLQYYEYIYNCSSTVFSDGVNYYLLRWMSILL
jgi:hypothetical protein